MEWSIQGGTHRMAKLGGCQLDVQGGIQNMIGYEDPHAQTKHRLIFCVHSVVYPSHSSQSAEFNPEF